jgi:protein gp37
MAGKSNIEWTGHTWNPIAGCSVKSPGCKHCYAMPMAARLEAMGQALYARLTTPSNAGPVFNGTVRQAGEHVLLAPLKRKVPTVYFVNSMSDLFHENVPDEWIDRIFAVMALCPQHTFQVLTKRAARMRDYMTKPHAPGKFITIADDGSRSDTPSAQVRAHSAMCDIMPKAPARALNEACAWQDRKYPGGDGFMRQWPLPNVWLGVSTERQQEADERIPELLATPAAVRFISAEPLLGPIDLSAHLGIAANHDDLRGLLNWVIVGGESGHGSRSMMFEWARAIIEDCAEAHVPCFMKQVGRNPILNGSPFWLQLDRKKGGDPDEWPAYLNVREMPELRA